MPKIEIKFSKEQYDTLMSLFAMKNLNDYDYNIDNLQAAIHQAESGEFILLVTPEMRSTLLDFVDDKKTEYGFNEDYDVNELGQRLTLLWDSIYSQN